MNCLYPKSFNGITVPCGKCAACKVNSGREWLFRFEQELKAWEADNHSVPLFITLTYEDEKIPLKRIPEDMARFIAHGLVWVGDDNPKPYVQTVDKSDYINFMKRLREYIRIEYNYTGIRFYGCSEYGPTTFRPHYHICIFNYPVKKPFDRNVSKMSFFIEKKKIEDEIRELWPKGFVTVDPMNDNRMRYLAIYSRRWSDEPPYAERTFTTMSRRPGIGFCWLSNNYGVDLKRKKNEFFIRSPGGYPLTMPRYYREKVFDDEMKAKHFDEVQQIYREQIPDWKKKLIEEDLNRKYKKKPKL